MSAFAATSEQISKFAATSSQTLYADLSGLKVEPSAGKKELTIGEKLLYVIQSTSANEIRKALAKEKADAELMKGKDKGKTP